MATRVGAIESATRGAVAEAGLFKERQKFAKSQINIGTAYNLGMEAVNAINQWNASTWQAEIKKIDSAYLSPYEQTKRIEETNSKYTLSALLNPNLALTQQEILESKGFYPIDKNDQTLAEGLALKDMYESTSKFTTAKEYREYVKAKSAEIKKLYPESTVNFDYNVRAFLDSSNQLYEKPAGGQKNYINTVNHEHLNATIDEIMQGNGVSTKKDVDQIMSLVRSIPYNPAYAGNVEKNALGRILEYNSDPNLIEELKKDPNYAKFFNDEAWTQYKSKALATADTVQEKFIQGEASERARVLERNKRGIPVVTTALIDSNQKKFNNFLMDKTVYRMSKQEIEQLRDQQEDPYIYNSLNEVINNLDAEFDEDFLKFASDRNFNIPKEFLYDLRIPEVNENEKLQPEQLQGLRQSIPQRYEAFNQIAHNIYKGDPSKANIFSVKEKNQLHETFQNSNSVDKWKLANTLYQEFDDAHSKKAPQFAQNWGAIIGESVGDKVIGEYLNRANKIGGDFASVYIASQKADDTTKRLVGENIGLMKAGLSVLLPEDMIREQGDFLANYASWWKYDKDKNSYFYGEMKGSEIKDKTTGGVTAFQAAQAFQNRSRYSGETPFYIFEGGKNAKFPTSGWFGSRTSMTSTPIILSKPQDVQTLSNEVMNKQLSELEDDIVLVQVDSYGNPIIPKKPLFLGDYLKNNPLTIKKDQPIQTLEQLLSMTGGSIHNEKKSWRDFNFSIPLTAAEELQGIRYYLVDVKTEKPYRISIESTNK